MRAHSIPALIRPFGVGAAILLAAFATLAPSAVAHTDTAGNNGTVKIHEGAGETEPGEVRNEPHVCTFHLHFYFADPEQAGTWEIQEWAPTGEKGTVVKSGTYDTAGDGEDRQPETGVYSLPDGHYKLFWDGDLDTGKHDKMKVFWVECAPATETPAPTGSELPTETPSETPTETPSETPTETPTETPSETPTETPTETPSETPTETPTETATATPTGSELPVAGSSAPATPSPTGGQLGAVGTPAVTPPATDVAPAAASGANDGWRAVLLALAGVVGLAMFLAPRPRRATVRVPENRRDR